MVGPGRTYHGFYLPGLGWSYHGFSSPPQAENFEILIQKHMDSLHRNAFPNRGITKKSCCGGSFPLPIIVYISPWKSKYQIQEQNHGSTFSKTIVVHLAKTIVVHLAKTMVVHLAKTMVVH